MLSAYTCSCAATATLAACLGLWGGSAAAATLTDQWRQIQQQQDRQREQDMMRQQQRDQDRQRRQQQEAQERQRQQQQEAQRRQRPQQEAQERQRQQLRATEEFRKAQQAGKPPPQGTPSSIANKPTGPFIFSNGVARTARPLTPAEISRGFTGKITPNGKALIRFQGRIVAVPASRISGLTAKLNAKPAQNQAAQHLTALERAREIAVKSAFAKAAKGQALREIKKTDSGDSTDGCGLGCLFNLDARGGAVAEAAARERIAAARLAFNRQSPTLGAPKVSMPGSAANMPYAFRREAEPKPDQRPPYSVNDPAWDVVLEKETVFARVYAEGGKPRSVWLLRKEDIEGLDAEAIQKKYALPRRPDFVVDVVVPAGARVREGTVGAQEGWGKGGARQYELKTEIEDGAFQNKRKLPRRGGTQDSKSDSASAAASAPPPKLAPRP